AVIAVYAGDGNFAASVAPTARVAVDPASTVTALAAQVVTVRSGRQVVASYVFTAVVNPVAPGSGLPTGTVVLYVGGAPRTAALVNGRAVWSLPVSLVRGRPVFALYLGDTRFRGGRTAPIVFG